MSKKHTLWTILCILFTCPSICDGQVNNDFNSSRQRPNSGTTNAFNQGRQHNFNDARVNLNSQFERIARSKWEEYYASKPIPDPNKDVKPVRPIKMSEDDAKKDRQDHKIVINNVTKPVKNDTRPAPIAPVNEVPEENPYQVSFTYLGTPLKVRAPRTVNLRLNGSSENAIADGWKVLSGSAYNNMLADCLKLRNDLQLCDWMYLMMLRSLGDTYLGKDSNESTLLMAFLFSQSGYKMRLASDGGRLKMLYASKHTVYNIPYYTLNGEKFFPMEKSSGNINISAANFPKEQSLSLWVANNPKVSYKASPTRTLTSERYPELSVQSEVNKNMLEFYDSYPTSEVGGDMMTRWAMYANMPISNKTRSTLYPQLKKHLAGKSQKDAVNRLLNWVQTAFVYELDDKVWGGDRAFFPDETLYYPYCDCEDRSILMSRLVRDLLGLKCILIFYPGHLYMAVNFTEDVKGDYIMVKGQKFVVTDPTYVGAPIGDTMPGMDNSKATVILLQ